MRIWWHLSGGYVVHRSLRRKTQAFQNAVPYAGSVMPLINRDRIVVSEIYQIWKLTSILIPDELLDNRLVLQSQPNPEKSRPCNGKKISSSEIYSKQCVICEIRRSNCDLIFCSFSWLIDTENLDLQEGLRRLYSAKGKVGVLVESARYWV